MSRRPSAPPQRIDLRTKQPTDLAKDRAKDRATCPPAPASTASTTPVTQAIEVITGRTAATGSILEVIAAQVRSRRQAKGWTQGELATRSGVSLRFLGQLEAATGNISVERLAELARALGTTPSTLCRHDSEPTIDTSSALHRRVDALTSEHGEDEVARLLDVLASTLGASLTQPRIALLGIRGAGKSTVGHALASTLHTEFRELDALVEEEAGMPLGALFELHGEASYRSRESTALERLIREGRSLVVATGGSIVTEPLHYRLLRETFTTVWLRARPEDHWERVVAQGDFRPMREHPQAMTELRALFEARRPLYEQAHHIVDTTARSVRDVVKEIVEHLAPRPPLHRKQARERGGDAGERG